MKDQELSQTEFTSTQIMHHIMDDIEKIDIGRFDYYYIPFKSDFTKAITKSIIQTCEKLGLRIVSEVNFEMPDDFRKTFKRKKGGIVDFIIVNPNGRDIALELDSSNKKASYAKLEVLDEKGFDSFWIIWKRNTSGIPYHSSYKMDYSKRNQNLGFTNQNVKILRHTFHADPK